MTGRTLTHRIDALEADHTSGGCIWIKMQPGDPSIDRAHWESETQARARWLADHPDRRADLECGDTQVRFVRRVFMAGALATA